jgi:hypothetical protein
VGELNRSFAHQEAIDDSKHALLHLYLRESLLRVVLDLLDVAVVLLCVEAVLGHPVEEGCLLWEEIALEFVPLPLGLCWFNFFFWL